MATITAQDDDASSGSGPHDALRHGGERGAGARPLRLGGLVTYEQLVDHYLSIVRQDVIENHIDPVRITAYFTIGKAAAHLIENADADHAKDAAWLSESENSR